MPPNHAGEGGVLCFDFNQNGTCLVVGTPLGVRVYRLHPFSLVYSSDAPGPTGVAELLFTTSLLALCGTGESDAASPRRLRVINTRDDSAICELTFVSAVLGVAMNGEFMAAVLDNRVHLYSLRDMSLQHTIETALNPRGTVALNADASVGSFIAVPGTRLTGELVVYECATGRSALHLAAHQSPIRYACMSPSASAIATASDRGTVVRVHHLTRHGGQLRVTGVRSLRRGMQQAEVYALRFGLGDAVLCASSNSGTVHVWRLAQAQPDPSSAGGWPSMGSVMSLLPSSLSDVVDSERSFATARIDGAGVFNVATVVTLPTSGRPAVQIATAAGKLYVFDLDMAAGGECRLLTEDSFSDRPDAGEAPPQAKVLR